MGHHLVDYFSMIFLVLFHVESHPWPPGHAFAWDGVATRRRAGGVGLRAGRRPAAVAGGRRWFFFWIFLGGEIWRFHPRKRVISPYLTNKNGDLTNGNGDLTIFNQQKWWFNQQKWWFHRFLNGEPTEMVISNGFFTSSHKVFWKFF